MTLKINHPDAHYVGQAETVDRDGNMALAAIIRLEDEADPFTEADGVTVADAIVHFLAENPEYVLALFQRGG